MRSKKHSFISLIQNYDPDIFVAVETWLCEEINDQSLFPLGYSLFRRDRSAHGGGVLIGLKSILSGQIIHVDKDYEFLICKFRVNNQNSFVIGCYRPPDNNPGLFEALNRQFQKLKIADKLSVPVFILGDLNLPSVRWDSVVVSSQPIYAI